MKIALVHDQLHEFGGAERVFFVLKKMFPRAAVFTAFYTPEKLEKYAPDYKTWNIKESFAAKIPFIRRLYSPLRFLAPYIWESFDFSEYDLVISSSGWYMCKGIKTHSIRRPADSGQAPTIHICYLHHPPRYLYGYETAMEWQRYWPIKIYAHIVNHFLRMWDYESSQKVHPSKPWRSGPDYFIANSEETKRRINKFYRRDAKVIYPPVDIPEKMEDRRWKIEDRKYYVTVSRLQRAKHVEILIKAANEMKFNLKIVGEGKDREYLESIAGPTIEFMGSIPDSEFKKLYPGANAFLFASKDEEFGIAPIEAMGQGVPVIAYASGGLTETVKHGENGYLYNMLSVDAIIQLINQLNDLSEEEYEKMSHNARQEAEKYSEEKFREKILKFIEKHA